MPVLEGTLDQAIVAFITSRASFEMVGKAIRGATGVSSLYVRPDESCHRSGEKGGIESRRVRATERIHGLHRIGTFRFYEGICQRNIGKHGEFFFCTFFYTTNRESRFHPARCLREGG